MLDISLFEDVSCRKMHVCDNVFSNFHQQFPRIRHTIKGKQIKAYGRSWTKKGAHCFHIDAVSKYWLSETPKAALELSQWRKTTGINGKGTSEL